MSGLSIGVGVGLKYNSPTFGKINIKEPPSPIASYRCYDKTNDDEDRDVLKDLSGNGHDIQLYNFAFSGESGYGKYNVYPLNKKYSKGWYVYGSQRVNPSTYSLYIGERNHNNSNVIVFFEHGSGFLPAGSYKFTGFRFKISNPNKHNLIAYFYRHDDLYSVDVSADGIYEFPSITIDSDGNTYGGFGLNCSTLQSDDLGLTFEVLPDYQGALVSDGVDDYGRCENFPILTKEKGYTVVIIRKWINDTQPRCLLSTHNGSSYGAFQIEKDFSKAYCISFGKSTEIQSFSQNDIIYQTSLSYNGNIELTTGNSEGTSTLNLFRYMNNQEYGCAVLYAFEIYDRDLTDDEIAKVKSRMIAEYESKTNTINDALLSVR